MWFWYYKIEYFDEGEHKIDSGVVVATKMSEAVEELEDYYGRDCIENILSLHTETEWDGAVFTKEEFDSIKW